MSVYRIFFSEDETKHASMKLEAPDNASTIARAVKWYRGTSELGPDWRRTHRRQLTVIEDQSRARLVAHSLSLDPLPQGLGLDEDTLLTVPTADLICSCMTWLDRTEIEGTPFADLLTQVIAAVPKEPFDP